MPQLEVQPSCNSTIQVHGVAKVCPLSKFRNEDNSIISQLPPNFCWIRSNSTLDISLLRTTTKNSSLIGEDLEQINLFTYDGYLGCLLPYGLSLSLSTGYQVDC